MGYDIPVLVRKGRTMFFSGASLAISYQRRSTGVRTSAIPYHSFEVVRLILFYMLFCPEFSRGLLPSYLVATDPLRKARA